MKVTPLTLEGETVRLTPSAAEHAADLAQYADETTFRYFVTGFPESYDEAGMRAYIDELNAQPNVIPFTIVHKATGQAIGMSCYMDIRESHDGLEVGMTWYGEPFRGTKVNPECKLLLIGHAIENLGAVRVQIKTDGRNVHSQRAIEKLGAVKEGVLRKHMIFPNGYIRDTVMYSILPDEWPTVKARLLERLA